MGNPTHPDSGFVKTPQIAKPMVIRVKKGALHAELGVKQGEKIPVSKLAIKPGDSPLLRKRKQFAINAKKWNH